MKSGIVGIAALGIAAMALSGCVYPPYGHGYGHGDYHHGPGPVSSGYNGQAPAPHGGYTAPGAANGGNYGGHGGYDNHDQNGGNYGHGGYDNHDQQHGGYNNQ